MLSRYIHLRWTTIQTYENNDPLNGLKAYRFAVTQNVSCLSDTSVSWNHLQRLVRWLLIDRERMLHGGACVTRCWFTQPISLLTHPSLKKTSTALITSTTSPMWDKLFSHLFTVSKNGPTNREADMLWRFMALSSSIWTISSTAPIM